MRECLERLFFRSNGRLPAALRTAPFLLLLAAPVARAQDVDYEKFVLDNGLKVILHEDHRLPVVHVNTWYDVGAKDEQPGRSGFAHLFEHLMFMGTERVPGSQFDLIMERGGGANNASTSFDRTNYFSWGPAELLPTLLWLDADRMEDLGRMMTREKLDLQRDVVRNERRQTSENVPYGRADLKLVSLLFPGTHPYRNEVIGSHADLEAATVDDVKEFFANYYVPNNAQMVVAGDFDGEQVKPLIEQLFGGLKRGAPPPLVEPKRPAPSGDIRFTMLDQVKLPRITLACVGPGAYQPGDAELRILAEILGREPSGRLYQRLVVEEALAAEVEVRQDPALLGSIFSISVLAREDADLDRVEELVNEEVERLNREGPTPAELSKVNLAIEREMLTALEELGSKADQLNEYEFFFGEPNSFRRDLERFRSQTPESVRKWRVLEPGSRVILRVLPEAPPRDASPRDRPPETLVRPAFVPEAPERLTVSGHPVALWHRPELPMVEVSLLLQVDPGNVLDRPGKAGTGALLSKLIKEGAGDLSALQFANALEQLGAELEVDATRESLLFTLSTLRRNLEPALLLLGDALLRPRLAPGDWQRVRRLHLEELKQRDDRPSSLARVVADRILFGSEHPAGWPVEGMQSSVKRVTLEDLTRLHQELLRNGTVHLVVAGDLKGDELGPKLGPVLLDLSPARQGAGHPANWAYKRHGSLRVVVVDRPGAVQTVIRFVMPGLPRNDERRVAYELLGTVLGGTFTSRLNANLREDKGYTYGASARHSMEAMYGSFAAASGVRADVTVVSIAEFRNELRRLREGDVTAAEQEKARGALRADLVESFSSLARLSRQYVSLLQAGLEFDALERDLLELDRLTALDLNALAREAVPLDNAVLVLVGDAGQIRSQAEGQNLPALRVLSAGGAAGR